MCIDGCRKKNTCLRKGHTLQKKEKERKKERKKERGLERVGQSLSLFSQRHSAKNEISSFPLTNYSSQNNQTGSEMNRDVKMRLK